MKVLFQNGRLDFMKTIGGDTVQMLETKAHLEALGVTVDISTGLEPDLAGYDLVHAFNLQNSENGITQIQNAKKHNLPVVLSTIYWELQHIRKESIRSGFFLKSRRQRIAMLLWRINWRIPYYLQRMLRFNRDRKELSNQRAMVCLADMLLPNSYAELEIIRRVFGVPLVHAKAVVVPNAATPCEEEQCPPEIRSILDKLPRRYVLEVASFQFVKGQQLLIKALMNDADIPLVFIGPTTDAHYSEKCREIGEKRGNVYFLGEIPHDLLGHLYKSAKVHALPSFRESTGLSTLEAALGGSNCVVSIHGPVAEYFQDCAWYCDPKDLNSIRSAVRSAWEAPPSDKLMSLIRENFTWEIAASKTYQAYQHVLASSRKNVEK